MRIIEVVAELMFISVFIITLVMAPMSYPDTAMVVLYAWLNLLSYSIAAKNLNVLKLSYLLGWDG